MRFALFLVLLACGTDVEVGRQRAGGGDTHGSDGDDWIVGLTRDDAGNIYIAGHHGGEIDLGGPPLVPTDAVSAFIASFTPSGEHRWSRSYSSTFIALHEIEAAEGRVHTVGLFRGDMLTELGTLSSPAFQALVVLEHDTEGALVSTFDAPGNGRGNVQGKSVDRRDGLVGISGSYVGDVDLGSGALGPTPVDRDFGLLAVLRGGTPIWSRAITGDDVIHEAMLLDGEGAVGGGRFIGTLDLGGGIVAVGPQDGYFAGFDAGGAERFVVHYSSSGSVEVLDAARSASGTVLVGSFSGSMTQPETIDARGVDAFVSSVDSDGVARWTRGIGSEGADQIFAVARDGTDVLACGIYTGELQAGDERHPHRGDGDAFAVAYDQAGVLRWVRTWGGTGLDDCAGIAALSDGRIVVAGRFSGTMELEGRMLESRGASDIYVLTFR